MLRIRKDLMDDGQSVPMRTMCGKDFFSSDLGAEDYIFEALQPDSWDEREFNLLLVSEKTGNIYFALSIDFEDYEYPQIQPEPLRNTKYKVRVVEAYTFEYEAEFQNEDDLCFSTAGLDPIEEEVLTVEYIKIEE